jgi:hypothetical protein
MSNSKTFYILEFDISRLRVETGIHKMKWIINK